MLNNVFQHYFHDGLQSYENQIKQDLIVINDFHPTLGKDYR